MAVNAFDAIPPANPFPSEDFLAPGPRGALGRFLREAAPNPVPPLLRVFVETLGDTAGRSSRERLLARISSLGPLAFTEQGDAERARLATEWLVSGFCPAWLRCAGLEEEADALRTFARPGRAGDAEGMNGWANACDVGIRSRLDLLPASVATEAWVFADRMAGVSGGAAAAALCRAAALGPRTGAVTAPPPWFTVSWRAWASGWLAINLAGAFPEEASRAAATAAGLRESAFGLLDSLLAVR